MRVREDSEKAGLKVNIWKTKIMASSPITSCQIEGENVEAVPDFIFLGSKITVDGDFSHQIKRCLLFGKKAMTACQKAEIPLCQKGLYSHSYGFSSSHVWTWELDHNEGWALKNWCFWIVVLEKTLKSPWDWKEIKAVNPKGNQSWIFIGRTDAEAEAPILWPPDLKSWLIGKDPDAGNDWRQKEKGVGRGWDGWIASLTQWTWIWANSRR